MGELEYELGTTMKNAASGPDFDTANLLYNPGEGGLEKLARHFNEHFWGKGVTPQAWKTADVHFILIPKKEVKLENLHLISLTSYLGKAF